MATAETLDIMALRYGPEFCRRLEVARLGEPTRIGEITVTFHPAGHVFGSAQIAIERGGYTVVVSGDYKRAADPTCLSFEPVRCDAFITEATFGLPVFQFPDPIAELGKLVSSLGLFPERAHLVGAYSLGKAQRVMKTLRLAGYERPIYFHGAVEKLTQFFQKSGIDLGDVRRVLPGDRGKLAGEVVICPPGALKETWARKFPDALTVAASGWMRVRARARQRGVELPLIISDHADWPALCATIGEVGCSELWVTHGEADALVHWAGTQGIAARPLHMIGYDEEAEAEEPIDEAA